jgi:hypothetical protein
MQEAKQANKKGKKEQAKKRAAAEKGQQDLEFKKGQEKQRSKLAILIKKTKEKKESLTDEEVRKGEKERQKSKKKNRDY